MSDELDYDWIEAQFEMMDWEPLPDDDAWFKSVYLGTVFSLVPSGKYYTPWANSNVEICPRCADSGVLPCEEEYPCLSEEEFSGEGDIPEDYHCEACQDTTWYQEVESEFDDRGWSLESGEGDPCDLYATIYSDEPDEED